MSLMSLGTFVFSLRTVPYQEKQRQNTWRHPASERLGERPVRQFMGAGDDTVTLAGSLKPEITGGAQTLGSLRTMADSGQAWPLIDGAGTLLGMFIIESLQETHRDLFEDGTARTIEFSITLQRTDEERERGRGQ